MPPLNYKIVFVIDPVRSDRIYLAKLIKHDNLTVMTFTGIQDCFKMIGQLPPDLFVYVLRRKSQDIKKLQNIKTKYRKLHFIIGLTEEEPDINLLDLKNSGFTSVYKAATAEKVREQILDLLKPEQFPLRVPTPHPIPYESLISVNLSAPQKNPEPPPPAGNR